MATAEQSVEDTAQRQSESVRLNPNAVARLKMTIRGAVQGVGFRPFIYRLATELELNGWVNNSRARRARGSGRRTREA